MALETSASSHVRFISGDTFSGVPYLTFPTSYFFPRKCPNVPYVDLNEAQFLKNFLFCETLVFYTTLGKTGYFKT